MPKDINWKCWEINGLRTNYGEHCKLVPSPKLNFYYFLQGKVNIEQKVRQKYNYQHYEALS